VEQRIIIGAGPAGLTAAYQLAKKNFNCQLLEREVQVGGLARTEQYQGYRFDIGGHRFFTKLKIVQEIWQEILPKDFLTRQRLSRIRYRGKYLDYPLKATNILKNLGLLFCIKAAFSYIKALFFPIKPEKSFEDWICNRFGHRLYQAFFKSYTEKVWGIPCTELSAEWAAQRIRGLSFFSALKNALFGTRGKKTIKTLIDAFEYPRLGPGQMWETMAEKITALGSNIQLNHEVIRVEWKENDIDAVITRDASDNEHRFEGSYYFSSMGLQDLIQVMGEAVPESVKKAAAHLGYRDFIMIALIIKQENVNPDNWIYIHDDSVQVGRIQNFKNWSPALVPNSSTSCLGLEYFCYKNDSFWSKTDSELLEQAKEELEKLKLTKKSDMLDGKVIRVAQAYPIYDSQYQLHVNTVREFLSSFKNLQLMGRNGMHKYNNQDHAMLSAILAVENSLGAHHNTWSVNTAEEYHEEIQS